MKCSCGISSEEECQSIRDAVWVKEAENYEYSKIHRLRADTYCMQHPEIHLISAKSFAAHLMGLCCAMEYNKDPNLIKNIGKWLGGKKQLQKPEMLEHFGDLTILHIADAKNANEYKQLVEEWAKDVWDAYGIYYELAHYWINMVDEQYQR